MKKFPDTIPVFPLSGVIYFPKTNIPLNIFEDRYLSLVNYAYNNDKLMGMVQSQKKDREVYKVGCLGKISDFLESALWVLSIKSFAVYTFTELFFTHVGSKAFLSIFT